MKLQLSYYVQYLIRQCFAAWLVLFSGVILFATIATLASFLAFTGEMAIALALMTSATTSVFALLILHHHAYALNPLKRAIHRTQEEDRKTVRLRSPEEGIRQLPISALGIFTPELEARLRAHGIDTADKFLKSASKPIGRAELAAKLGITPQMVLTFAERAHLAHIVGVGTGYGNLLEAAGIDSVRKLAASNADELYARLCRLSEKRTFAPELPPFNTLKGWILNAGSPKSRIS